MTVQRQDIDDAAAAWGRSAQAARLEKAELEHSGLVERFPPTIWPDLPLDSYALGLPDSEEGFSYWLEWKTATCGSIRGGSAHKHLVYRKRNAPGWYFETKKYGSEEEAWAAIKQGFSRLVELADAHDWDAIDEIPALRSAQAVRCKTAWMYHPDELLPVFSDHHLDYFLRALQVEDRSGGPVAKNRRLLAALRSREVFRGWRTMEIMFFLYDWSHPDPTYQILKIAPGEQAVLWDDCRDSGYIRVGWDELGDLSNYEDREEIFETLMQLRPERGKSANRAAANRLDQYRSLKGGDIIVANRGTKTVIGIGQVDGGYEFRDDLPEHKNVVDVTWNDTLEREGEFGQKWMRTIVPLKASELEAIQAIGGPPAAGRTKPVIGPVPAIHLEAERLLERSGQLILFGPPGTGKTYTARRHGAWLVAGGSANQEAATAFTSTSHLAEAEHKFSTPEVSDERPAWLLVANPRQWTWDVLHENGTEEFSYGKIRANYDEMQTGDVVYGYEATPTKQLVARARIAKTLHTDEAGEQVILIDSPERVEAGPTWDALKVDPLLSQSQPVRNRMQGTVFRLEPEEAAQIERLCAGAEAMQEESIPSPVPRLTRVTFHPTYAYEDFVEGYKPVESGTGGLELSLRDGLFKRVCRAAAADPRRPYVVIIDEINRGNVPKIFGELITLLEKDKRGVTVTLPQSGDPFQVPPNVFLIGTMNTADRSIHVLDAALRRRFSFLELLPEPDVLEGPPIGVLPLDELLREINARIREQIGREKQIGHALFMNGEGPITSAEDFALVVHYELLPLLQEYSYGDYGDLAHLLGEEIIDIAKQAPNVALLNDPLELAAALATHLDIGVE